MTLDAPNIVLINCDDLGYGDLGCYGSGVHKTPVLDRMAEEGVRFDSFYMASPVCSPSRAALLTGCYPPRISFGDFGAWGGFKHLPVLFPGQDVGLPPEEISIATVLRRAGYRTQMVGKWHCGDQPQFLPLNHGFDQYFGIPYSNDMGRQVTPDTAVFKPDFPPLPLLDGEEIIEEQPDQSSLTERYVTEVLRFIRADRTKPFFVYLAHLYVHLPIYVQSRFAEQSENGAYGAAVESIDWATSVILREIRRLGIDDDTLVMFTSDNGSRCDRPSGGSNAPLRGTKGTTWEGGQRVPFIARWPERIRPGRVVSELATAMDLFPTLAALGGGTVPDDRIIDGRNISGLLFDEGAQSPHEAFYYYMMHDLEAVRDRRWKLHIAKRRQPVHELYDLIDDPGERLNVVDDHPEVVARLQAFAEDARRTMGDARLNITGSEVRPIGRVDEARTLTEFDPTHPYYMAEYDLPHRG